MVMLPVAASDCSGPSAPESTSDFPGTRYTTSMCRTAPWFGSFSQKHPMGFSSIDRLGDSHNLSIEEKPMGCFCEKLPNQGAVRHMEVVYLVPGKSLVLSGALGPLQSLAATGSMTIQLSAAEGGTKLAVGYAVTGYLPAGMNTWAAPVDAVITEQFSRLKNLVERGDPKVSEKR